MSATQIIQDLPKFTEPERRAIWQVLAELAAEHEDVRACNQAASEGALMLGCMVQEDARSTKSL